MSNIIGKGVKASLAFFIANVITSGISYITTPIYTRMLTTDEFGAVSVFLTWLNLFGIIAMFFFHFVVNIGMAMGIMPITGIPLLFLSYGGSSLWTSMMAAGILINIYYRRYGFKI